jgi:integrase
VYRVVPLTTEQTLAIRTAMPPELRAMVTLGAGTGMRQSEVFGLTLDRLDFLRRTVTVDRQVLTLPGRGPAFGPPKTKASVRTIPLPRWSPTSWPNTWPPSRRSPAAPSRA